MGKGTWAPKAAATASFQMISQGFANCSTWFLMKRKDSLSPTPTYHAAQTPRSKTLLFPAQ